MLILLLLDPFFSFAKRTANVKDIKTCATALTGLSGSLTKVFRQYCILQRDRTVAVLLLHWCCDGLLLTEQVHALISSHSVLLELC